MSRELFKGMTYKDSKVYTRQCSSNVSPKYFYSEENSVLTKQYNKLGKIGFEKWFILNCLIMGGARITNDSNVVLKKLGTISDQIWLDSDFRKLYDKNDELFEKIISIKKDDNVEKLNIEVSENNKAMEELVSKVYDDFQHLLKRKEFER